MTLEEAKKVAAVVSVADHGCSICVESLCYRLNKEFPKFHFYLHPGSDDVVVIAL